MNKNLKLGPAAITSKGISMHKKITDLMKIENNKGTVFDWIQCNNGKDRRYVLGYQTYEKVIIKTTKYVIGYGAS